MKKNNHKKAPFKLEFSMFNIITLPDDFASTTIGYVGTLFSDLSTILTLIIGVLLGVLVIEILIGAIKK